jgi:hypothetical protein
MASWIPFLESGSLRLLLEVAMPGPAPKPESKRRRYAKPKSYGDATPTTAPAAPPVDGRRLGIDNPHPLIVLLWDTVQKSCEATFFSETDWQRLRLECWYANHTMVSGRPSAQAWGAIQPGLNELLLSPAVKRRAGIEVKPAAGDADENEAVSLVGKYHQVLKSV